MRVPHGSTIVITDGRKRLIARNEGEAAAPSLKIVAAVEDANPATSAIATDAAGRTAPHAGRGGGSSIETADPHDHEEERFAIETAALLRRGVEQGDYESLIVVAAPRTLGVLRKHYHKMVSDRIIGEIDKDVTGSPIGDIEKMLIAR